MRAYPVSRSGLSALGAVFLVASLTAGAPASAQSSGVSCFLSPAKLADSVVADFSANPAALLAQYPQGGHSLMSAARTLVGSDVRTAEALIDLAKKGSPEAKSDIAVGLANAAASCVWTRPDISKQIQEKVAASEDAAFITSFQAVIKVGGTGTLGGGGFGGTPFRGTPRFGTAPSAPRGGGGDQATTTPAVPGGTEVFNFRRGVGAAAAGGPETGGANDVTGSTTSVNNLGRPNNPNQLFRPDGPVSPTMQ
jgi:hypothetical protein